MSDEHAQCLELVAELQAVLKLAGEKLMLYREQSSGEYIGGMEFRMLMNEIERLTVGK